MLRHDSQHSGRAARCLLETHQEGVNFWFPTKVIPQRSNLEKSMSVSSFVRAAVFQRGKRSRFIFVVKLYIFFLCKLGKGNFEAGAWKNGVVFMF